MSPLLLGILASAGGSRNSYESIQTVTVGSGGQSSIAFTSIPSTYKHLQVRGISRSTAGGSSVTSVFCTINSSVGADRNHYLYGNGSTVTAGAAVSNLIGFAQGTSQTASSFGAIILDILDYADTNKNKTFRSLAGDDVNGGGDIMINSNLFATTSVITALNLTLSAGNFAQYSSFALYGIKG
jgi:hypothetical protein